MYRSVSLDTCQDKRSKKIVYLNSIQIGERVELYSILKNGSIVVTKRSKIGVCGFVCPRFLREITVLQHLMNPPDHLKNHPGRDNIVRLLDVYEDDNCLHFDMERVDGTICDLSRQFDLNIVKEQILIDISDALNYVHEMGYNHNDLSLTNIGFIRGDRKTKSVDPSSTKRLFRFVLLDFGNSLRISRPFTLESSTIYTLPVETIDSLKLLSQLDLIVRLGRCSIVEHETITNMISELKIKLVHRKSDLWSLGALSYYLHFYDHYADGDTIDEQKECILKKGSDDHNTTKDDPSNRDVNKVNTTIGNNVFLTKTKEMLTTDPSKRPIVYFSKTEPTNSDTSSRNMSIETYRNRTRSKNQSLCHHDIENIITDMSDFTVRRYLFDADKDTMYDVIDHTCRIETRIMDTVLNNIQPLIDVCIPRVNAINIIRVFIVWLVTHLYGNHVWAFTDVLMYLMQKYVFVMKDVIRFSKIVCLEILNAIGCNFESVYEETLEDV